MTRLHHPAVTRLRRLALAGTLVGAGLAGLPAGSAHAALPSATLLSVAAVDVGHGQQVAAAAQVTVAGAVPDGWVYFVVDGVSRRTDVAADGTAATVVEGLPSGTHTFSATFVPRDPALQDGSTSAEASVAVHPVAVRGRLRVSGLRTDRTTVVGVRLRAPYGTEPTGKARLVVRRRGSAGSRNTTLVLEDGAASRALGRLAPGGYRVVLTYLGDGDHLGLRLTREVRIRRPRP